MRDWILVGLGEGTVGYKAVAGHIENLATFRSGRTPLRRRPARILCKGKGERRVALDHGVRQLQGKERLRGKAACSRPSIPTPTIPCTGTLLSRQYDASSARKLFLKIERDQFYALFGDFDTGLTVTELSKYSRKMNGVKAEYQGKNVEANVFGSETAQAYAKDEMQGDGTSGLYHLSHTNIVLNSDTVTIEVRDRFRSEVIISTVVMNRFTD
jgi:hypothetical protein